MDSRCSPVSRSKRIWVLGPLCEGATFYNNLVPSPGVYSRPIADAHRCAAAMLAARTPARIARLPEAALIRG